MNHPKKVHPLLKKYLQNRCTPEEKEIVEQFFEKLQQDGVSSSAIEKNIFLKKKIYDNIQRKIQQKRKRSIALGVAAVIVVLFTTTFLYKLYNPFYTDTDYLVADVSYGQQLQVVLSDSTIVHLNSGSSLHYPATFDHSGIREVTLSGEGFFEVTKNPNKPFIVNSGEIRTKVLGTKFVVKRFNNDSPSVIVTEGRVNVSHENNTQISVDILPDEKVTFDKTAHTFVKTTVASENYMAWIEGDIVFNNSNLIEVAKILERRFNISVKIHPAADTHCTISGKHTGAEISEVLESIGFINGINYSQSEDQIELKGSCRE